MSNLASLSIVFVSVPTKMTHFFKLLDLTVNGEAKRFMKDKFTTWYPEEVHKQINPGKGNANGEVNVDLRLTALKLLHASWFVDPCATISAVILIGTTSLKGGKGWHRPTIG